MKRVLLTALFLVCAVPSVAKQIDFDVHAYNGRYNFAYKWKDVSGAVFNTRFGLYKDTVDDGQHAHKRYDGNDMLRTLKSQIERYVDRSNWKFVKIDFYVEGDRINYQIRGRVNSAMLERYGRMVDNELERLRSAYLRQGLMTDFDDDHVAVDHIRVARESIVKMRPVAEALHREVRGQSRRAVANHVLNFLQSIPYDTLDKRGGSGFLTPAGVLISNKGDCDSKAVMFMAIMKNIYPHLRSTIVYVPRHAFIGLEMPAEQGDASVSLNGVTYVLAEPVGPAIMPVGYLTQASSRALQRNEISYKPLTEESFY